MKLNNKGFAITAVLYSLLILFLMLFLATIKILNSERNRLEKIANTVETSSVYMDKKDINEEISKDGYYVTPYRGKYIFSINDSNTDDCYVYLPVYTVVKFSNGQVTFSDNHQQAITTLNLSCNQGVPASITSVKVAKVFTSNK